jgi:molybdate transport system substrate-binding protein
LKRQSRALFVALAVVFLSFRTVAAEAADVTVFAASSLGDALQAVGKSWQQKTGHTVTFSFAASPALAKQIQASAFADMFISADTEWMDYLDSRGLMAHDTRINLLGNHLVLIAPSDTKPTLKIVPHLDIGGALQGGRLAVADTDSVPAGKYAKTALMALGVWNAVVDHLAQAENVRVALAYVARGEAPLGIVYTTDAMSEPKVRIVDTFPENTHQKIVYPAALTKEAKPLAKDFLAYLEGAEASAIFGKAGFVVLAAHRP